MKPGRKKGSIPWNKGKKLTKEHIQKLRDAKLGKKQTVEHIANAAKTRIGHVVSEETREKIRQGNLGRKVTFKERPSMKGLSPWNKGIAMWAGKEPPKGMLGKKHSKETRTKMSEILKGNKRLKGCKHKTT